ncbi:hypothetical protein BDZ94DRAFT_1250157, partial [Collybia nuda]
MSYRYSHALFFCALLLTLLPSRFVCLVRLSPKHKHNMHRMLGNDICQVYACSALAKSSVYSKYMLTKCTSPFLLGLHPLSVIVIIRWNDTPSLLVTSGPLLVI